MEKTRRSQARRRAPSPGASFVADQRSHREQRVRRLFKNWLGDQFLFDLYGIILARHYSERMIGGAEAGKKAVAAFERLLESDSHRRARRGAPALAPPPTER